MEKIRKKKIISAIIITIAVVILLFFMIIGCIIGALHSEYNKFLKQQKDYLTQLENNYNSGDYVKLNEQDFCSFDINNASKYKFIDTRYIGTHNSYKAKATNTGSFMNNIVELVANEDPHTYDYGFASITDQLNSGIRSLELDGLLHKNGFWETTHHPYIDTATNCADFLLGLKEIALWSQHNPDHMPITILFEIKEWFVPIWGKSPTLNDFIALDDSLEDIFGESLFTPDDMLGECKDFEEMRNNNAWPTLDKLLGKVMIILHPSSKYNKIYSEQSVNESAMFLAVDKNVDFEEYKTNTCFAVANYVTAVQYNEYYEQNYFIRSRCDNFPYHNDDNLQSTIKSNCNIMSTDFPITNPSTTDDYVVKGFVENYTITLKDNNTLKS